MKTCRDSIDALRAYLDSETSAEDTKALEEHLNGCSPCVEFVRQYRATSDLCRQALIKRMPPELANRLTDFLRSRLKK